MDNDLSSITAFNWLTKQVNSYGNALSVRVIKLPFDDCEHLMLINGQSGIVASDIPDKMQKQEESEKGGLLDFLSDLIGE